MRLVFLWRVRLVPDTGTEPGYFDTFIGPRHDLDAYVEAENKAGAKWRVRQRHASCDMPPWTQSGRWDFARYVHPEVVKTVRVVP